ncbi:MAG: PKD domain-containing protein [Bacteroidota bacterium]
MKIFLLFEKVFFYFSLFQCKIAVFAFLFMFPFISNSQTVLPFPYTGSPQTYTVPCGVDTIHVKAWGAGGSGGGADSYGGAVGGAGAFVESYIVVTPGQTLTMIIAGGAGPGSGCVACSGGGSAGMGGGVVDGGRGGNAGCSPCSGGGGGGGGGAAVYSGATPLVVAGGGGGGSGGGQFSSGGAGGAGGQNGNPSPGSCASVGISGANGTGNGSAGQDKGGGDGAGGGGGGGGYNGSSGGASPPSCDCGGCGGGGGSSYSSGFNTTIINGNGQTPGGSTDPDLPAGAAVGGGTSTKGGDGYIIFSFDGGSPETDFTSTTVCNGAATQFTNNSITASGSITSTSWDFGNSTPVNNTVNPSYIYPVGGTYTVSLIVTNNYGCADTTTKSVQVYYNPVAAFSQSSVCFGDSMNFLNTSTIHNSTSIASYLWSFGDGSPNGSIPSPAHYYSAGTYPVLLLATSADGCMDTASAIVKTFDAPISAFLFSNTCLFDSAKFTNTSINPVMGTIASWSWDYGDGSALNTTVWNPRHLYTVPGNYQVTLITYSSNLGCSDTLKDSITVFPMPVSNFSFADVCLNQAMIFSDSSTVLTGSIAGRSWDFGDGTPVSTAQDPSHIYASPGTYPVTLIVTSNNSCKDTIVKSVVVHPLPTALFSSLNVCDGTTVQFSNSSTIPANPTNDVIQSWTWDFADGSPFSISQNTSHLYSAAGSYAVQLLVVSNFGCPDSITKTTIVNPNPTVLFSASDTIGCEPLCVDFQNLSTILTGTNASRLWNLGDGSLTSNTQDANHCYINNSVYSPLTFDITLTVTSDSGCVTTVTKSNYITVNPNPNAVFTVDPTTTTIIDPIISIKDLSIGTDNWNWDFGDGSTPLTTSLPVPHTYSDTGTYLITLITSTQYGCADTSYKTIIIDPEFVFYIPNSFSPDGDGMNDTFMGKGLFIKEFKMTIFDRWGNSIFISDDISKSWNGKANRGPDTALQDVYIYVIEIKDFKNKNHSYKGIVTLVK